MPPIYRAPMRARDRDDVEPFAGARLSVERGLVGIGDSPGEKGARTLGRFVDLPDGTFVWTRTSEDEYWLGRIDGPYRREEHAATGIDHVRPARWIAAQHVPAAVRATFARGGLNLQRIHDADAEAETAEEYAREARAGRD